SSPRPSWSPRSVRSSPPDARGPVRTDTETTWIESTLALSSRLKLRVAPPSRSDGYAPSSLLDLSRDSGAIIRSTAMISVSGGTRMALAVRVHTPGGPEVMVLEEVALAPPGPTEATVRHTAIGLNFI